ncbi:MAG: hypothetical protein AB7E79_08505 [Rhodospirillaceae bacterium]
MNAVSAPQELKGPLRAFFDFWRALPKTHLLPTLADFLDRVPPELAPFLAIVDVRGPEDASIRFFGTQLVDRAAFDPTGMTVGDLYAEKLRPAVHRLLWEAVTRPVGYLSHRKIVGRTGFVDVHPSCGLPIDIPTSSVRGVVNYSRSVIASAREIDDKAHLVQDMKLDKWLDIGAGVPG